MLISATYLTIEQLTECIHYDVRTIRDCLKDSVLFKVVHDIHPFGGRKPPFLWEAIKKDIHTASAAHAPLIRRMARG